MNGPQCKIVGRAVGCAPSSLVLNTHREEAPLAPHSMPCRERSVERDSGTEQLGTAATGGQVHCNSHTGCSSTANAAHPRTRQASPLHPPV